MLLALVATHRRALVLERLASHTGKEHYATSRTLTQQNRKGVRPDWLVDDVREL